MKVPANSVYNILIVEDEVLIADATKRYVESAGHSVVGTAISFEEGLEIFKQTIPDLVLIDIRLNGEKSGIDLARQIQNSDLRRPFIYLTAQTDSAHLDLAKKTLPGGFLPKPLQKEGLITTIEIVMHKYQTEQGNITPLIFNDGTRKYLIPASTILFLKADHVYVRVFVEGGKSILQRSSIKELIAQLPADTFLQTHRSFVVNKNKVTNWDAESLRIEQEEIPVSRSRRKQVFSILGARS